ncbi:MAG TPA: hypothetical protein VIV12_17940, partial [Streptosporangiaceae bacterium]
MAEKSWAVGEVLSSSDLNVWALPLVGVKSANQTIISQTSLVNDADMRFAMAASALYQFQAFVRYDSGTGQDIKFSFSVPAGADARYSCLRKKPDATFGSDGEFGAADTLAAYGEGVGTLATATLHGIAYTTTTAGNLIFQWAQNVS